MSDNNQLKDHLWIVMIAASDDDTQDGRAVARVTAVHRRADQLVGQPRDRGTGNGVLLALIQILDRDPRARLLVLPSDHHQRHSVPGYAVPFETDARGLLRLFVHRCPEVVAAMREALMSERPVAELVALYEDLPELDFRRDVLEGQEHHLQRTRPVRERGKQAVQPALAAVVTEVRITGC